MKKSLLARTSEVNYLILIYLGAYLGNPFVEILLLTVTWILIMFTLLIVVVLAFSDTEHKLKLTTARQSKSPMSKLYSYAYDALIFCLLFYFGYVVLACFWALTHWLAVYITSHVQRHQLSKQL